MKKSSAAGGRRPVKKDQTTNRSSKKGEITVDNATLTNGKEGDATVEETGIVAASSPGSLAETQKQTLSFGVYQPRPLPQNRPIGVSNIRVITTYNTMGLRPVTAAGLEFSSSLVISGNRPIAKSNLAISENYNVMGNRPVAPNDIEDITSLIGYLD